MIQNTKEKDFENFIKIKNAQRVSKECNISYSGAKERASLWKEEKKTAPTDLYDLK